MFPSLCVILHTYMYTYIRTLARRYIRTYIHAYIHATLARFRGRLGSGEDSCSVPAAASARLRACLARCRLCAAVKLNTKNNMPRSLVSLQQLLSEQGYGGLARRVASAANGECREWRPRCWLCTSRDLGGE